MSVETPSECESTIFNASCWIGTATGDYVKFPIAQGNNILLDLTATNIAVTDSVNIANDLSVQNIIADYIEVGSITNTSSINTDEIQRFSNNPFVLCDVPSIQPITIGSNTGTSQITIDTASVLNTNATPAIAIGTSSATKTIKINNGTSSVHCSSIELQGSTINNITHTTGNVSVGNLQTSGILNLGNLNTRTGAINVGADTGSTSSYPVNIGLTTTDSIKLGGISTTDVALITSTYKLSKTGLTSTSVFDLAPTGLTFGGLAGTLGQFLTSRGAGLTPNWTTVTIPPSIIYQSGTINATLTTSGSVVFSPAFTTLPKIFLTTNSGSSSTITVCGLSTKSVSGFSWVSSFIGASIDWFAVE